jgi:hypothetical protein
MEYFVYIYNSENGIPYYVGKGSRKRVFMRHEIPVPPKTQIQMFPFSTEQEAWDTEIDLIALFKRKCDGGTLFNLSTGGASGTAGTAHSPERRQRASIDTKKRIAKLGHPQQGRRGARCHNSLVYLVTTPDSTEVVVKGITQFCRDNNLSPSAMVAVAKGRRPHHKGYKCSRLFTDPG